MSRRRPEAIVFVGPTLPPREVWRELDCEVRGPAARGDVWAVLPSRPRAIVLLDGVFEASPSVWHRELLAALDAGVAVFGASSMGALRAVELLPYGMVGVGQVFRWYRDGVLVDDADVALLHASAEEGHRPLTVPHVNVLHAALEARRARVLTKQQARALVEASAAQFYQDRRWPTLLDGVDAAWSAATRRRFEGWRQLAGCDLKARDGRECLRVARAFLESGSVAPARTGAVGRPSSLARRRKLLDRVPSGWLDQAGAAPRARAVSGLRSLLLASLARSMGLRAPAAARAAEREGWLRRHRVPASRAEAFLAAQGMDRLDAERFFEDLALEALLLAHPAQVVSDGPSELEALAFELRKAAKWPYPPSK